MYLLGALFVTGGSKSSSHYYEGDDEMGRALSNNKVNLRCVVVDSRKLRRATVLKRTMNHLL